MTKTTEEYLSQIKYAEHRNVTKGYISRMVKEGRLHLIKGKLNVEISDAELDNKSNNNKAPNYWSERALHEKAKRELAEKGNVYHLKHCDWLQLIVKLNARSTRTYIEVALQGTGVVCFSRNNNLYITDNNLETSEPLEEQYYSFQACY